jgi:hypothetical protein
MDIINRIPTGIAFYISDFLQGGTFILEFDKKTQIFRKKVNKNMSILTKSLKHKLRNPAIFKFVPIYNAYDFFDSFVEYYMESVSVILPRKGSYDLYFRKKTIFQYEVERIEEEKRKFRKMNSGGEVYI